MLGYTSSALAGVLQVEKAPVVIKASLKKEEADELVKKLEAGALRYFLLGAPYARALSELDPSVLCSGRQDGARVSEALLLAAAVLILWRAPGV